MKTNAAGIALIKKYEAPHGPDLQAYKCPAGVWTIAYGNTFYPNGRQVRQGDVITRAQADQIFDFVLDKFEKEVTSLVKSKVTPNQFAALVSFAWNVGSDIDADLVPEGLGDSTLLKLVNGNPTNPGIRKQSMAWNKAKGKVLRGLINRRQDEANLFQLT